MVPFPSSVFHLGGCPQLSAYSRGGHRRPLSSVYWVPGSEPDTSRRSRLHTLRRSAPQCKSPVRSRLEPAVWPPEPPRNRSLHDSEGRGFDARPITELYLQYLGRQRWAAFDVEAPGRCVEKAGFGARHTWFNLQQIPLPAVWAWAPRGNPLVRWESE